MLLYFSLFISPELYPVIYFVVHEKLKLFIDCQLSFTDDCNAWINVKKKNHCLILETWKSLQADRQLVCVGIFQIKAMFPSWILKHLTCVFVKFLPVKKKKESSLPPLESIPPG